MATPMARIFRVLLFFIALFCVTFLVGDFGIRKVYAYERWGSHVICYGNDALFSRIYSVYGGADWYPVTVMLSVDEIDVGINNLKAIYSAATNGRKIRPVLRLTTNNSSGSWDILDPISASAVLNQVDPATYGIPTPVYVAYGNEPNMKGEWGGTVNPAGYGNSFRTFASKLTDSYAPLKGPLNLSFPTGHPDGMDAHTFYSQMGTLSGAKGLGSNPYELSGCAGMPFNICSDFGVNPGPVDYPATGEILSIPKHEEIDIREQTGKGGPAGPVVFTEFGLKPDINIVARKAFLERAYANSGNGGPYKSTAAEIITPLLLRDREAGSGETLPYIAIFKKGGGVEFINCNTENCGSTTCNGGSTNPIDPINPTPYSCTPNQYSLTIKGTIKSSEVFAIQKNAVTGETVLINRRTIPQDRWVNYSFINNQPVNGAIVAIYPSYAFTGSDNYGNQIVYSPGKRSGKLYAEGGPKNVKVGADGNFEITTSNTCDEVWQYGGWKQYLVVMCPENRNGATKPVVKDLYAFPLNRVGAKVTMQDINVACDADLTALGNVTIPPDLEYMTRDPQNFLACGATLEFPSPTKPYRAENWDNPLLFKDYIADKQPWPLSAFSGIVAWLEDQLKFTRIFKGSREGFIGIERTSCDIRSQFSSPIELYGGVKTDSVELAKYYLNGNPGVDTYNNFEQKLPLPLCTELRDCSMAVSFNGENNNMQSCGGMANNLRAPYDTTVTNATGVLVADELGYAARYRNTAKSIEVCKDSNSPGSTRHTFGEIAPPEGICGNTNLINGVDGGEMPCPDDPKCGDQNNDGSIIAPEVICSGGGITYNFDSRYFPYDVLFTQTTEPKGNLIEQRQKSYNDSVSRPLEGGRDTPFSIVEGDGGSTRPNNLGDDASKFPEGFNKTKFPAGLYSSDAKRMDIGGNSASQQNPASLVLSNPVNFGSTADSNTIRSALTTLSNNISFDPTVEFYKIGIPDSLCTCSIIENGSNGMKNCVNAEKAGVETKLPLSLYNNLSDWDIYSNGYSDLLGRDAVHILQPGYKFAGDTRTEAAGNADFIKSYYKQKMSAGYELRDAIVEFFKCLSDGIETRRDRNDVIIEQNEKGHCTRLLPTISKNKTMIPWAPDMSETKNALISMVALDEPFVPKVRTISLCEIDSGQTKSQDPTLEYGLGQEHMWASKSDNVTQAATFMKNSVSSPSFGSPSKSVVPAPPLTQGPPPAPLPPGSCAHTLQMDSCTCGGMSVQDPGRDGVTVIGDLGFEIKGTGSTIGTSCFTWVSRWLGEPQSTSCSLASGTYRCHLWGSYGPGVCNVNLEKDLTCP